MTTTSIRPVVTGLRETVGNGIYLGPNTTTGPSGIHYTGTWNVYGGIRRIPIGAPCITCARYIGQTLAATGYRWDSSDWTTPMYALVNRFAGRFDCPTQPCPDPTANHQPTHAERRTHRTYQRRPITPPASRTHGHRHLTTAQSDLGW